MRGNELVAGMTLFRQVQRSLIGRLWVEKIQGGRFACFDYCDWFERSTAFVPQAPYNGARGQRDEKKADAHGTDTPAHQHGSRSKAKMELMTTCEQTGAERLVKSADRVRGLEVLNTAATVELVLNPRALRATPKPVKRSVGERSSKRDS